MHRTRGLTPAQQFFFENREVLLQRAQQYHEEKMQHFDDLPDENSEFNQHSFDTFYRDPVVRPPKGHLWDFGDSKQHIPR